MLEDRDSSFVISSNIEPDIGRKLYFPCYVNFRNANIRRTTLLLDSGADTSVMEKSYFLNLFSEFNASDLLNSLEPTEYSLSSFSNHTIKVFGKIEFKMRIYKKDNPILVEFLIIDDQSGPDAKNPVILSLTVLGQLNLSMEFMKFDNIATTIQSAVSLKVLHI